MNKASDFRHIQAITFDAGGTLIEPWPSVGDVYASVAAALGFPNISPDTLNQQFAAAWKEKEHFDYSRAAWRRLVEQSFAGSLIVESKLFDALYEKFAHPDVWRVYDDVVPTLRTLKERGYKLAVISNWDERLVPLLERLGLNRYLDKTILSVQVGATKPSERIFRDASSRLGVPPETILHVGDSLEEDVRGAISASLQALYLARHQPADAPESIATLTDLLHVLD